MSKRLASEAKLILERAGFTLSLSEHKRGAEFLVSDNSVICGCLPISGGTVDNTKVVNLLAARGYDESGHPKRSNRNSAYDGPMGIFEGYGDEG